jgi:hypothetical protein
MQTSKRIALPTFSISKLNQNLGWENFRYWLDECYEMKTAWETKTRQIEFDEELKLRDSALKTIKSAHYSKLDYRKVWNWIALQLCDEVGLKKLEQYRQIFLSGDLEPELWEPEDVDDLWNLIVDHCDAGNEIMHCVRTRLHATRDLIRDFYGSFSMVTSKFAGAEVTEKERQAESEFFASFDKSAEVLETLPPEPQRKDFETTGMFIKAQAQWRLLKGRFELAQKRKSGNQVVQQGGGK